MIGPLPPLTGSTALITGGNSGIGLGIAGGLASVGAHVIIAARNPHKNAAATRALRTAVPGASVEAVPVDLSDFSSVVSLAQMIRGRGPLDILIADAGLILLGDRKRHQTVDGMELHFQTNFLGHAALIEMVRPSLEQGRVDGRGAVVVAQSSVAAEVARIHWGDLQLEHSYSAFRAYAQSKLALTLWALAQGQQTSKVDWENGHPRFAIAHPGIAPGTGIAGHLRTLLPAGFVDHVTAHMGNPPAMAALPSLMAIADTNPTGKMYVPDGWLEFQGPPALAPQFRRAQSLDDQARMAQATQGLLLGSHALAEFL